MSISMHCRKAIAAVAFGVAAVLTGTSQSSASSVNVLPSYWDVISTAGTMGVLRAGAPFSVGPLSSQLSLIDNAFLPAGTIWNQGTWWWDADPSVNNNPVVHTIALSTAVTVDRFVLQGDNNDAYQIDYWNGASFVAAYTAAAVGGAGMRTRDSGLLAPITTNLLRITASGGDGYYSLSEIQAFSATVVPVPGALLLFATGAGVFGVFARRRRLVQ